MLFQKLTLVSMLAALGAAQADIDLNDVPQQCRDICSGVSQITDRCDRENEDANTDELNCICTAQNANTLIPNCEACVRQYDNEQDSDIYELLTQCSFTTTSAASGAQASSSMSMSMSGSGSATITSTTDGTTVTSVVPTGSGVSGSNTGLPEQTTNAAPAQTAGAAFGLGALGMALLL